MKKKRLARRKEHAEYVDPPVHALREESTRLTVGCCRLQFHISNLEGTEEGHVFGRNVKRYRKPFDLSRVELADMPGIGRSMLTHIENGPFTTIERMLLLCEIFHVTPNDLLL